MTPEEFNELIEKANAYLDALKAAIHITPPPPPVWKEMNHALIAAENSILRLNQAGKGTPVKGEPIKQN